MDAARKKKKKSRKASTFQVNNMKNVFVYVCACIEETDLWIKPLLK